MTTPFCTELITDATQAIELEDRFDKRLVDAETQLRATDLDSTPIAKMRGVGDVRSRYVELAGNVTMSRNLMKQFKARLKDASSPTERMALQDFANALDGALHHQQSLADELGRLVAFLDSHEPLDQDTRDRMQTTALANAGNAHDVHGVFDARNFGPTEGLPPQLSTVAKAAATSLEKRSEPLADDEQSAADRIDRAFAGC